MKRLEIIRVDPNTGYVTRLNSQMQRIRITETMPYKSCMAYVMKNQEDAKVYKIGRLADRINAKRRHHGNILAANNEEAISVFSMMQLNKGSTYQLCTGDWKLIAQRDRNGFITTIH